LSPAGLAFYYRDFYDGLGEAQMEKLFASGTKSYRNRAASLRPYAAAPANWLDVGCGHGHFCATARSVFHATDFHGLDFSDGAKIAERLGRVSVGYSGSFVELAPAIAGRYAVVSMFHYLEHSTAPEHDLAAAHTALAPGGHLLIEVPDPECRMASLLGKWWGPWLQPQHLHFVPEARLREKLTALGFRVLTVQRREPHIPVDLVTACWLMLKAVAPKEDLPWRAAPGRLKRVWRTSLFTLAAPLLFSVALVDALAIKPFAAHARLSNTYRLIAQRA
jgi:SAM-dependent methyltransferase